MPMVSYPYLIRVVGSEKLGTVFYLISIINFFRVFVKYGFEMSAVKNIAENSNNPAKRGEVVSTVLTIQLILYFIGLTFLYFLIEHVEFFQNYEEIIYFTYLLPLSDIFLFLWFFQGIEKMKYITAVNIISNLLGVVFIFLFIQEENDYIFVPLLQASSFLIGAIFSIWLVFRVEKIKFILPDFKTIRKTFLESTPFFYSRVSAIFNLEINTVLFANFVSLSAVAYYDLAKKIIEAMKIPNTIIDAVLYPHIARSKDKILAKKILYVKVYIALFFIMIILFFGEYFVLFLGGAKMVESNYILNILSILLLLTAITYYTGATLLVSFGKSRNFNLSVVYATILNILLSICFVLLDLVNVHSILFIIIFTETFVTVYRLYYCRKYKIL
jgi:PST family polysaccharide transporter